MFARGNRAQSAIVRPTFLPPSSPLRGWADKKEVPRCRLRARKKEEEEEENYDGRASERELWAAEKLAAVDAGGGTEGGGGGRVWALKREVRVEVGRYYNIYSRTRLRKNLMCIQVSKKIPNKLHGRLILLNRSH